MALQNVHKPRLDYQLLFGKMSPRSPQSREGTRESGGNRACHKPGKPKSEIFNLKLLAIALVCEGGKRDQVVQGTDIVIHRIRVQALLLGRYQGLRPLLSCKELLTINNGRKPLWNNKKSKK